MPELELLEARPPVRTPRLIEVETEPKSGRFAPVAGWLSGPVFSRAKDIFAANMAELLDRAEDPARMIRMIILEMEETLVELRSTAARSIADLKELRGAVTRLERIQSDWTAKAALAEKQKATDMADTFCSEIVELEQVLKAYEADIARLQAKLSEARGRQHAIAARFESAVTRAKAREIMHGSRTQEAFSRFELLERQADFAEGRAEALGIGSLEDQMKELSASQSIDRELEAMKAALKARVN